MSHLGKAQCCFWRYNEGSDEGVNREIEAAVGGFLQRFGCDKDDDDDGDEEARLVKGSVEKSEEVGLGRIIGRG